MTGRRQKKRQENQDPAPAGQIYHRIIRTERLIGILLFIICAVLVILY